MSDELGAWATLEVRDKGRGVTTAVHVVPVRELRLHSLAPDGSCSCEPEDDNIDSVYDPPLWVHHELTELH